MAKEQPKLTATYVLPGASKGIYKRVHIKWGHSLEECLIGVTLENPRLKKWQLLGEHCPPLTEVPSQARWHKLLKVETWLPQFLVPVCVQEHLTPLDPWENVGSQS